MGTGEGGAVFVLGAGLQIDTRPQIKEQSAAW